MQGSTQLFKFFKGYVIKKYLKTIILYHCFSGISLCNKPPQNLVQQNNHFIFFSPSSGLTRVNTAVFCWSCLRFLTQLQLDGSWSWKQGHPEQGRSTNYNLRAKSELTSVFVSKALLVYSPDHLFRYCLWLLPRYTPRVSNCNRPSIL